MIPVIVYYSLSGNNRLLVQALRERLHCEAHELRPQRARGSFDLLLDAFWYRTPPNLPMPLELTADKHVILVAPIWNAKIAAPMRTFANNGRDALASYSFVTLCAGREGQETKLRAELQRFVGKPPLQLLQLEARELLSPEHRRGREPSKYRVLPLDLTYFAPKLDRFVSAIPQSSSSRTCESTA